MEDQIRDIKSLDTLLILGGENLQEHSRSNHAYTLYSSVNREEPLSLVLTGRGSGLSTRLPEEPEAVSMQKYLLSLGVPNERIYLETQALDTLGNMVFSRPVLDQILSGYGLKRVGLVTDGFHMDRSLWTAKRVFGEYYRVTPLPTGKQTSLIGNFMEVAIKNIWRFDLWDERIETGDQKAFEQYMREKHPLHASNAPWGLYKTGIACLKLIKS